MVVLNKVNSTDCEVGWTSAIKGEGGGRWKGTEASPNPHLLHLTLSSTGTVRSPVWAPHPDLAPQVTLRLNDWYGDARQQLLTSWAGTSRYASARNPALDNAFTNTQTYLGEQYIGSDGLARRRDLWEAAGGDDTADGPKTAPPLTTAVPRVVLPSISRPYVVSYTFTMRAATGALLIMEKVPPPPVSAPTS